MKMICDRTLLANAVAGVSKAVTQRSSIPVLEGILMKAEGFSLTLTGYDLEMGITTSIEANVLEPGEVVLSAKLLGDMVRRLSSSEVEITATETNATTIKGGITEFDIMGMNPGDFPELPSSAPCWPRPSTAGFPPARASLPTYPWTTGTACASTPWPGWAWWRAWERAASPPTRQ